MPKAAIHGIREPLWYGTGIHYSLEKYYDPTLNEDPVTVWLAWFDLQWNGGEVTAQEVSEYVDREPEPVIAGTTLRDHTTIYKVKGLSELLPFAEEEKFLEMRDLGRGMMEFYKQYAAENDDFKVLAVEHNFSVPILDPKTGAPLYMLDRREMPEDWEPSDEENIYGPLMRPGKSSDYRQFEKQVHARGRMDKIIQEYGGPFGIHDYKTTSRLDDDYFRHLELDEQCTTYLWAGEQEAKMYDLEYDNLEFINYEAILKAYPRPPTMLKNGLPSVNRQEESTTAKMFEEAIVKNGLQVVFDADPKLKSYYEWLLEKGTKRFIHREPVRRNKTQRKNAGIRIFYEAIDMLSDPKLYPNPRKEYTCLNCIFRAPCIAAESGNDFQSMLEDGYVPNWDR